MHLSFLLHQHRSSILREFHQCNLQQIKTMKNTKQQQIFGSKASQSLTFNPLNSSQYLSFKNPKTRINQALPSAKQQSNEKNKQKKQEETIQIGAYPQVIQNCDLQQCHDNNVLYSNGKRSLVMMNLQTQTLKSSPLDDQRIISAVYHPALDIYLINTEKRILAVNSDGEIIYRNKIPQLLQAKHLVLVAMEDGYESVPTPNTRRDLLLYTTNQYMYRVPIQIKYERSLLSKNNSKNLCSMSIQLLSSFNSISMGQNKVSKDDGLQKNMSQILLYEWVANLRYLPRINMLICWNPTQTYIYQLPKKTTQKEQLLLTYDKISKKSASSTQNNKAISYQVSLLHRLLLVSFQSGSIKVYKLDETKKYVCELKGHQRECTSLFISNKNHNLLYSTGLDNTIRVWDLIDLIQVYQVRLDLICHRLELLSEKIVFGRSYDKKKTYLIQLNLDVLQPVLLSEEKSQGTRIVDLACDGQWGIALYSNNLVQAFLLNEKGEKSRQFNQKIQFPIKYGFLRSSLKIQNQKYGICLQKGFSILKLNKKQAQNQNFYLKRLVYNHSLHAQGAQKGKFIQIIHQKLLGTYFFTILQDWKNIPIAITVTSVTLLLGQILPKWDLQVQGRTLQQKRDYVILGTDRGYIYFVDTSRRQFYYSRVGFHSNSVVLVQRIYCRYHNSQNQKINHNIYFVSLSKSNELAIWSLSRNNGKYNQAPKLLLRVRYTLEISVVKIFGEFLAIGRRGGQFTIFRVSVTQDQQLICEQNVLNRQQGHLKAITYIDHMEYQNPNTTKAKKNIKTSQHLFITSGEDRVIKIWSGLKKQLIFEVKMFNYIFHAVFLHQGIDFMISHGHNSQITLLRARNIQALARCKQKIEQKMAKCLRQQDQLDQEKEEKENADIEMETQDNFLIKINLKEYLCVEVTGRSESPSSPLKRKQNNYKNDLEVLNNESGLLLKKKKSIQNPSEIGISRNTRQQQYLSKMTNIYASSILDKTNREEDRLPITERKKSRVRSNNRYVNSSAEKTSEFMILNEIPSPNKSNNLFLPKITDRLQHRNPTMPRVGGNFEKGVQIKERLGHSRINSFSHAGKNNY